MGDGAPDELAVLSKIIQEQSAGALFTLVKMIDIIFDREHACLVQEFAAEGGEAAERIVEAAAFYRETDLLIKRVSASNSLTAEENLFLAVLSCSFDRKSFETILRHIYGEAHESRATTAVRSLTTRLDDEDLQHLRNTFQLFGLKALWPEMAIL